MAKHPFWGASNVGWWMVVITRPVAGTQAANEAPNAAKTSFWGRKGPQTLLHDVTSGGAPSSSGSSRPKFSVPPSAAGSSHTFSGIPGSTPHPGISLPGGGPLGPLFNPGPLALWVEVSVNLRTTVQQHAVDHYWIPPWFRNVLGDMSLGNGDKSWNLAREYRDLRRPGFPNMFQFAYWMQYRELSLLGCLPLDPYGTLSTRRIYGHCIWDTITCKPSDESKTAYSDSEVKTACLEVQKALLNALVVANGYIGEIRSRGLTINPVLNLIPWPIHEASGVCDSQATERLASMGFTAELAVEMWHFLQGWLANMIKASTTPWGWTREELQEFLDGSIGDGEIPPTSAIPSDSLILRPCNLPYSNKMDQHSQTRRIINKPTIPLMPLNISIRYNEDAPGVPKSKSRAESIAMDDMRHGARLNRAALHAGAQQAVQNTVSPSADASKINCDSSTSIHHREPMSAPSSSSSSSETSHSSSSTPSNEQSTFTALFPTIVSHIDQNYDLDFSPETFWPQQSAYGRSLHASIHAPSPPITFGTTNNSVHAAVVAPIVEDGEVEMGSVDIGDEQP
ncbi:hypothetical protein C8J57DRAFT_1229675 [Mycena rebaudengoi]|nr:hypothetical protein C8J57DRAFT_1229675 [Mycena rebaudengoi]